MDAAKEFIAEFSNFMYKLDNQTQTNNELDEFKLFAMSDNIASSLANEQIVKSILLQFNEMMETMDEDQEQQKLIIAKLNKLKLNASTEVESYQAILDTLNQKKNYLIQFMQIYKEDKLAEQTFSIIFDSRKDIYNAIVSMVEKIVKKDFSDLTHNITEKLKELKSNYEDTIAGSGNLQPIAWPVYPIQNIEMYFGDKDFEKEYGFPNQ